MFSNLSTKQICSKVQNEMWVYCARRQQSKHKVKERRKKISFSFPYELLGVQARRKKKNKIRFT